VKGFLAEKLASAAIFLCKRPGDIILNDIYIPAYDGLYTQIDHVLIRGGDIFVIETKSYSGNIRGTSRKKYWIKTGKEGQRRLYNPVRQNSYHIGMLKSNAAIPEKTRIHSIVCLAPGARAEINTKAGICTPLNLGKTLSRLTGHRYEVEEAISAKRAIDAITLEKSEVAKRHRINLDARRISVKKGICPRCGSGLSRRRGRRGEYLICKAFPRCTFRIYKHKG
jgi:hypothetical protein